MQEVKNKVTLHHACHDIMLINLLDVTIIRQEIYYSIKLPNTKKEMKLYSTKSSKKNDEIVAIMSSNRMQIVTC